MFHKIHKEVHGSANGVSFGVMKSKVLEAVIAILTTVFVQDCNACDCNLYRLATQ